MTVRTRTFHLPPTQRGAFAFEIEEARHRTVLPVLRWRSGRRAIHGCEPAQVKDVEHEAGVREQL
jgi:hypothetical protein